MAIKSKGIMIRKVKNKNLQRLQRYTNILVSDDLPTMGGINIQKNIFVMGKSFLLCQWLEPKWEDEWKVEGQVWTKKKKGKKKKKRKYPWDILIWLTWSRGTVGDRYVIKASHFFLDTWWGRGPFCVLQVFTKGVPSPTLRVPIHARCLHAISSFSA